MEQWQEGGDASIRCWLAFNRSFGVLPRFAARALRRAGSPGEALRCRHILARELRAPAGLAARLRNLDLRGVEEDLQWLSGSRRHLLWIGHADYPHQLSEVPDPPPVLFVEGDPESLTWPMLAIVGSRNASATGRDIAHEFARKLGEAGIGTVSGLALGIDASAHRGAMHSDAPTVAVCARGLDRTYPRSHEGLAQAVCERGALVSEFPVGVAPLRSHFPRRNRIISGLSVGVLVVEASRRSGALITARRALEQGRDVFAVPGSIRNPLTRGCHQLIRAGAIVAEGVQDVFEELAFSPGIRTALHNDGPEEGAGAPCLGEDARRTLDCLGFESTPVDVLVERVGLTADALSSILMELELDGYVKSTAVGSYERTAGKGVDGIEVPDGAGRSGARVRGTVAASRRDPA